MNEHEFFEFLRQHLTHEQMQQMDLYHKANLTALLEVFERWKQQQDNPSE